jgi:hypothetical protein
MLGKEARLKNDNLESNIHGLPIIIENKTETIGDIKFKNNSGWSFQIELDGRTPLGTLLVLRIAGAGAHFEVNAAPSASLSIPGEPNQSSMLSAENYTNQIDEVLGGLIVYLNDTLSNTNR